MPSATAKAGAASSDKRENPELARFRAEWLAELQSRRAAVAASASTSQIAGPESADATTEQGSSAHLPGKFIPSVSSSHENPSSHSLPTDHPALNNGEIVKPHAFGSTALERALNVYRRAVELEQKSELDEALVLYRQAFRLVGLSSFSNDLIPAQTRQPQDDNVDRAYRREEMLQSILREQQALQATKPSDEAEDLTASFQSSVTIKPNGGQGIPSMVTGTLASLVQDFMETELKFESENENEPVLLNMLPEELLVVILGNLDSTSIERFAAVSKKARLLTLDPGIWR